MQDGYWRSADDPRRVRIAPPAPPTISSQYSSLDNSVRSHHQVYDPAFPLDVQPVPPPSSLSGSASSKWSSYDLAAEERMLLAKLSHTSSASTAAAATHQSNNFDYDRYRDTTSSKQRMVDQDDYYSGGRPVDRDDLTAITTIRSDRLPESRVTETLRRAPPLDNDDGIDEFYRRPKAVVQDDITTERYRVSKPKITDDDILEYLMARRRERALTDVPRTAPADIDTAFSEQERDRLAFRRTHRHDDDDISLEFGRYGKQQQQQFVAPSSSTTLASRNEPIDDNRYIRSRLESDSQQQQPSDKILIDQNSRCVTQEKKTVSSHSLLLDDIPQEGRLVDLDSPIPHALFRRKVTHVDGVIGFAGTDVFFQMNKVSGPVQPLVGSLVLVKAEKMYNMPFQWSALTVDVISLYPPDTGTTRSSQPSVGDGQIRGEGSQLETIPLNLPSFDHSIATLHSEERPLKSILKNKPPPPPPIISATRGGTWRTKTPSPPRRGSPEILFEKGFMDRKKRSPSPTSHRRVAPERSPSPTKSRTRGDESKRSPTRRRPSVSPRRRSPRRRSSISPRRRSSISPRRRSRSPKRSRYSKSPPRHDSERSRDRRRSRSRSHSPVSSKRRRSRSRTRTSTGLVVDLVKDCPSERQSRSPARPKPLLSPKNIMSLNEVRDRQASTRQPNTAPKSPAISFTWKEATSKSKQLPVVGKKPVAKKVKEQLPAFIVVSDKSKDEKKQQEPPKKDEETKKKITNEIVKNIQEVREKLKNEKFKILTQVTTGSAVVPNPLFTATKQPTLLPMPATNLPVPPPVQYPPYRHDMRCAPPINIPPQQPPSQFYPPQQHQGTPHPYPQPQHHQGYPPPGHPPPPMMYQQQQPSYRPPPLMNFQAPFIPAPGTNNNNAYFNHGGRPPILEPTHVRRTTVLTNIASVPVQKTLNTNVSPLKPASGNLILLKNPIFDAKAKEPLPPGEDSSLNKLSKVESNKTSKTTTSLTNISTSGNNSDMKNKNVEQNTKKDESSGSSSTVDSASEFGIDKSTVKKKRTRRGRRQKGMMKTKGGPVAEENWDLPTTSTNVDSSRLESSSEKTTKQKSQGRVNTTEGTQVNDEDDDDEVCMISVKPASALFDDEYIDKSQESPKMDNNKVTSSNTTTTKKNTTTTENSSSSKINEDILTSWEEERIAAKARRAQEKTESGRKELRGTSSASGTSSTNSRLSEKLTDTQKQRLLEKEKDSTTVLGKSENIQKVKPTTTEVKKSSGENSRGSVDAQLVQKLPSLSTKLSQRSRETLQSQIVRDEKEKQEHRLGGGSGASIGNLIPSTNYSHGGHSSSSFRVRSRSPNRPPPRHHISNALHEPVIRICRRRSLSPPLRPPPPQQQIIPNYHQQIPFSIVDPMKAVAVKQLEIKSLELRDRELQYEMQRLMVERESYAQFGGQQRYF